MKLKNWELAAEDCRRALELDPNLIKGHFFLGQAVMELIHYDEAIVHLQRALDLAKELNKNYGDEIAYQMRLARKRRWNMIEEKRKNEEIELLDYLTALIIQDKNKQFEELTKDVRSDDQDAIQAIDNELASNAKVRIDSLNDLFTQVDNRRKVNISIFPFVLL